jgi:hypothetical protein
MAKLKVMNSTMGFRPAKGRADAEAGEAVLGDRRVDDAAVAELLQQALADLVGALVLADFLAHQEDLVVAAHLLGHGVAQRFAHGHRTISVPAGISGSGEGLGCGLRRPAGRQADSSRRRRPCVMRGAGAAAAGVRGSASPLSPSPDQPWRWGVLTFTFSVPAAPGSPTTPSSTASTSIVALSVSISAMTSPALTVSPSFHQPLGQLALFHRGREGGHQNRSMLPALQASTIDVGPELGRVRLRAVLGEFGRLVDDGLDLAVDGLEIVLVA